MSEHQSFHDDRQSPFAPPTDVAASPFAEEPTAQEVAPAPLPQRARIGALVVVMALVAGFGGGALGAFAFTRGSKTPIIEERVSRPPISSGALTGVAAVAQQVMPSMVRIDVAQNSFGGSGSGTGSGVLMTSDGYIITNNHVIQGATSIEVTLATGEKLPARLIGTAAPTDDIAVVKVDRTGLTKATLGTTATLSVGDLAVAVGSPFGLQGSVTAGVISALHRNIDLGQQRLTDAVQTDAPINPGNSGGALANASGEVIGINTAILGSAGNVGVGFAIPIDIAKRDAEQIIKTGRAQRPLLGISGENLPNNGGAVIQEVTAGGAAEKAGLKTGDVITGVDSTVIRSMDDLIVVLTKYEPGQTVTVGFMRGGSKQTVKVKLAARSTG